jgi:putative transposase
MNSSYLRRVPRPSSAWAGVLMFIRHRLGPTSGNILSSMPWGLKRLQQTSNLHFVTFSCYKRRPNLGSPDSRGTFEAAPERVRQQYELRVYGYVVMPEHVHLLVSEPERGTLAQAIQSLKQGLLGGWLYERPIVLAGALLRLQCLEPAQVGGETPLHSPQSSHARVSGASPRTGLGAVFVIT